MKHAVSAIFVAFLLVGCNRSPNYGGTSYHSYGNSDRSTTTSIVKQYDPSGSLLFIVAWTNSQGGGSIETSGNNLLVKIHGKVVHPSLTDQSVYALQPDGSLAKVALNDADRHALFAELIKDDFHVNNSDLWQREVATHLHKVEE